MVPRCWCAGAVRGGARRRCPPGSHTASRDGAAVKGRAGRSGAGRSGAEQSATSLSCGADAPQPQPPLPVPPPLTEQRGRDPPACPARGRPRPPPPPIPAQPGPPGPRGGFFLLLGSSYFNYFPPLFSTKNFSTLMNFRVSTFLKGPPGSDLGRGRAVPSVHPRGGETRLSPAGVREPRDCTFVTSDESPEPQEQQPSELRTGICNPGTAALSLRRAAPNPPRQYPRSPLAWFHLPGQPHNHLHGHRCAPRAKPCSCAWEEEQR